MSVDGLALNALAVPFTKSRNGLLLRRLARVCHAGFHNLRVLSQAHHVRENAICAGNALRKLSTLRDKLTTAEADSLQIALVRTAKKHMNLIKVSEVDHLSIASLARSERISYYDAAYVQAARDRKRELVTDDAPLAKVASKFLKVKGSADLPTITGDAAPAND